MNKALRADLLQLLAKWNVLRGLPPGRGRERFLRGAGVLLAKYQKRHAAAAGATARNGAGRGRLFPLLIGVFLLL